MGVSKIARMILKASIEKIDEFKVEALVKKLKREQDAIVTECVIAIEVHGEELEDLTDIKYKELKTEASRAKWVRDYQAKKVDLMLAKRNLKLANETTKELFDEDTGQLSGIGNPNKESH